MAATVNRWLDGSDGELIDGQMADSSGGEKMGRWARWQTAATVNRWLGVTGGSDTEQNRLLGDRRLQQQPIKTTAGA